MEGAEVGLAGTLLAGLPGLGLAMQARLYLKVGTSWCRRSHTRGTLELCSACRVISGSKPSTSINLVHTSDAPRVRTSVLPPTPLRCASGSVRWRPSSPSWPDVRDLPPPPPPQQQQQRPFPPPKCPSVFPPEPLLRGPSAAWAHCPSCRSLSGRIQLWHSLASPGPHLPRQWQLQVCGEVWRGNMHHEVGRDSNPSIPALD